jgi:hypothetical protein
MALDEFGTVLRARRLVRTVNPTTIPVPLGAYLEEAGAVLREQTDLGPDEPGFSFSGKGKHFICVNANDRLERQRFTVCHELAHIVLGLPSDHNALPWWSYAKRPLAEILCDVFAAELLLPCNLFERIVEESSVSLATVDALATRFLASVTATGSRFAWIVSTPCAFVLSEQGRVRYASRSKALRDANAWIPPRTDLPDGSLSERVRAGGSPPREEVDAALWFTDWERGGVLLEEARYLAQWDQTLTLLWFESEEVPQIKRDAGDYRWAHEGREDAEPRREDEEEFGLQELDGNLRWPSKKRRG